MAVGDSVQLAARDAGEGFCPLPRLRFAPERIWDPRGFGNIASGGARGEPGCRKAGGLWCVAGDTQGGGEVWVCPHGIKVDQSFITLTRA